MTTRQAITVFILCLSAHGATAAEPPSDQELTELCIAEVERHEGADNAQGPPTVVSADVEHEQLQQIVRVQLSYGEGRSVGAQCTIRDGQIFDFKD